MAAMLRVSFVRGLASLKLAPLGAHRALVRLAVVDEGEALTAFWRTANSALPGWARARYQPHPLHSASPPMPVATIPPTEAALDCGRATAALSRADPS